MNYGKLSKSRELFNQISQRLDDSRDLREEFWKAGKEANEVQRITTIKRRRPESHLNSPRSAIPLPREIDIRRLAPSQ